MMKFLFGPHSTEVLRIVLHGCGLININFGGEVKWGRGEIDHDPRLAPWSNITLGI
jgi:hypothetical protein